jgi:hypothetical protein
MPKKVPCCEVAAIAIFSFQCGPRLNADFAYKNKKALNPRDGIEDFVVQTAHIFVTRVCVFKLTSFLCQYNFVAH